MRDGTEVICNWALSGCGKTRVNIPSSVTNIGESAFWKCSYINVDKNNAKYTSIDGILYSKDKAILVRYPNRKGAFVIPSSVTSIYEKAFYVCEGLTSVTIPDSVTEIGERAFENCFELKNVILPNSIKEIEHGAFNGCEGLTNICIPDNVKKIGALAFLCCLLLKTIHLPSSVKEIGKDIFKRCEELEKIYIPHNTKEKFSKLLPEHTHLLEEMK